ncbi:hypothetical protein [Thermococcus barophilus]|uniref:Uncharacterized protein n=1 Tax=Thermococcus barophilus TaxID=55802 RepID=A0A0S1XF94_THEBA|nr:hypothetical protein [Thermococcus barophilus]ALM76479.1 hypothetical protein TBCH5v1_2590 [Thermococcus barophilus]
MKIEEKARFFELRKKLMKGEITQVEAVELKALLEKMKKEATKPFEKQFLRITELALNEIL